MARCVVSTTRLRQEENPVAQNQADDGDRRAHAVPRHGPQQRAGHLHVQLRLEAHRQPRRRVWERSGSKPLTGLEEATVSPGLCDITGRSLGDLTGRSLGDLTGRSLGDLTGRGLGPSLGGASLTLLGGGLQGGTPTEHRPVNTPLCFKPHIGI